MNFFKFFVSLGVVSSTAVQAWPTAMLRLPAEFYDCKAPDVMGAEGPLYYQPSGHDYKPYCQTPTKPIEQWIAAVKISTSGYTETQIAQTQHLRRHLQIALMNLHPCDALMVILTHTDTHFSFTHPATFAQAGLAGAAARFIFWGNYHPSARKNIQLAIDPDGPLIAANLVSTLRNELFHYVIHTKKSRTCSIFYSAALQGYNPLGSMRLAGMPYLDTNGYIDTAAQTRFIQSVERGVDRIEKTRQKLARNPRACLTPLEQDALRMFEHNGRIEYVPPDVDLHANLQKAGLKRYSGY